MSEQPPRDGEYLTLNEAAELLGITRQHMRRVALANGLRAYATPMDRRAKLYRRADVLALRQPRPLDEIEGKELAVGATSIHTASVGLPSLLAQASAAAL
jgi:excisionase family DNA binding protein